MRSAGVAPVLALARAMRSRAASVVAIAIGLVGCAVAHQTDAGMGDALELNGMMDASIPDAIPGDTTELDGVVPDDSFVPDGWAPSDVGAAPDAGSPAFDPGLYIKASNTEAGDRFSIIDISADGTTLAVGAPGESSRATGIDGDQTDDSAPRSGAVYVFVRSGATWVQQAYIKASNAGAEDGFGWDVALSADGATLAVGAPNESSGAVGVSGDQTDDTTPGAGAVYVFTRVGATWTQDAYLKASDTETGDSFGRSVAISADGAVLAVAALNQEASHPDVGVSGAGAIYTFERAGGAWAQTSLLKPSNAFVGGFHGDEFPECFGCSLAISGDGSTLAVGANQEQSSASGIDGDPTLTDGGPSGAVFVYARTAAGWAQQAYLKPSNNEPASLSDGDLFSSGLEGVDTGIALSYDGSILAAGAPGEDSSATGIDGDQADDSARIAGAVYLFARTGATWAQVAYIKASNAAAFAGFGNAVALTPDGLTLAVAASEEDSIGRGVDADQAHAGVFRNGAVYVFRHTDTWRQVAYVKATNTEQATGPRLGDEFGQSVVISGDGTLVVAAPWEASAATGIGGDAFDETAEGAGAVYVYESP